MPVPSAWLFHHAPWSKCSVDVHARRPSCCQHALTRLAHSFAPKSEKRIFSLVRRAKFKFVSNHSNFSFSSQRYARRCRHKPPLTMMVQLPRAFTSLMAFTAFFLVVSFQISRSLLDQMVERVDLDESKALFVRSVSRKVTKSNVVHVQQKTPPRKFTKVPKGHEKTFFYDGKAISRPIVRALRSRGWQKVNDEEDAHMLFFYGSSPHDLKPWQRFNHIPNSMYWNQKDWFAEQFKNWQDETGRVPYFLPDSYILETAKERKAFKARITEQGGIDHPWVLKEPNVNQGKGIEIVPPNSDRLLEIANLKQGSDNQYIIQQYICNELTWNQRKFDVRMFWYVASVDPLVVLYQDGYARIGNSVYKEDDFKDTVAHLTTHTGLGEEGKATYDEFSRLVMEHYKSSPELAHIRDPMLHVKSQFKASLAEFIAAFKKVSFSPTQEELYGGENGFGFYGADFILDNDLDAWLIEPQKGCGMDEDYDFRVDMHNRLFRGMVDTFEEIWQKQEDGEPVLPLENTGDWEVIYADGWQYSYDGYERSKNKKGCSLAKTSKES